MNSGVNRCTHRDRDHLGREAEASKHAKLARAGDVPAEGGTAPSETTPDDVARAQQGEQQRSAEQLRARVREQLS